MVVRTRPDRATRRSLHFWSSNSFRFIPTSQDPARPKSWRGFALAHGPGEIRTRDLLLRSTANERPPASIVYQTNSVPVVVSGANRQSPGILNQVDLRLPVALTLPQRSVRQGRRVDVMKRFRFLRALVGIGTAWGMGSGHGDIRRSRLADACTTRPFDPPERVAPQLHAWPGHLRIRSGNHCRCRVFLCSRNLGKAADDWDTLHVAGGLLGWVRKHGLGRARLGISSISPYAPDHRLPCRCWWVGCCLRSGHPRRSTTGPSPIRRGCELHPD
jgi:hypothetical protein